MGLLSNRIDRSNLKPGDHIYSWRTAYTYSHHGIYVGDNRVIHFTARGQEIGTGSNVLDRILVSSSPFRNHMLCTTCVLSNEGHGVFSSCLNCFLARGVLYRFEYSVKAAHFLGKARGTCTLAVSDPNDIVIHRAKHLLLNGFGCYDLCKNNCEDFALYCKTGLISHEGREMGQSSQVVSTLSVPAAAVLSLPFRLVFTNVGMAVTAVGMYWLGRYANDIGIRNNVVKMTVEDLTTRLSSRQPPPLAAIALPTTT